MKKLYIKYSCIFLILAFLSSAQAQISGIINAYTKVTAIDPSCPTLTVTTTSGFAIGDKVLIIQMKGATVSTANNTAFGDITAYNNAGNYEFTEIEDIQGLNILLKYDLLRTYTPAGLVQLVTIPQYVDVTVTGTLTAQAWNGNTGGVLVFEASGTVTLNADIDVSGLGFRGGKTNINDLTTTPSCVNSIYLSNTNTSGAGKGESISEYILNYENGCGKQANGGGGGLRNNSGGGGGSNYGNGGKGGNAAACSIFPNAPGVGATSLVYNNIDNKVFLGGGGGSGHQNNLHNGGHSTPGGNGGGIIIIKANAIDAQNFAIKNTGIISSGPSPATGDGGGGGGGGGSTLLDLSTYISSTIINVSGGKGDDLTVSSATRDLGPGGGGGGGILWVTNSTIDINIVPNFNGGVAGISIGGPCSCPNGGLAGSPGGSLVNLTIPRAHVPSACSTPLSLIDLKLSQSQNKIILDWSISQNPDAKYFEIQRSVDGYSFETIGKTNASLNSSYATYSFTDPNASEQNGLYYRLKQIDSDGGMHTLGTRFINTSNTEQWLTIMPNPFNDYITIKAQSAITSIQIFNINGKLIEVYGNMVAESTKQINTSTWNKGIYIFKVVNEEGYTFYKLLK